MSDLKQWAVLAGEMRLALEPHTDACGEGGRPLVSEPSRLPSILIATRLCCFGLDVEHTVLPPTVQKGLWCLHLCRTVFWGRMIEAERDVASFGVT